MMQHFEVAFQNSGPPRLSDEERKMQFMITRRCAWGATFCWGRGGPQNINKMTLKRERREKAGSLKEYESSLPAFTTILRFLYFQSSETQLIIIKKNLTSFLLQLHCVLLFLPQFTTTFLCPWIIFLRKSFISRLLLIKRKLFLLYFMLVIPVY